MIRRFSSAKSLPDAVRGPAVVVIVVMSRKPSGVAARGQESQVPDRGGASTTTVGHVITVDQLLGFGVAALILIAIPGPSVVFVIGRALAYGRGVALASVAGNSLVSRARSPQY